MGNWIIVALALLQDPSAASPRAPRFGAFLEQHDDLASTGFVAYDRAGQWWIVPRLDVGSMISIHRDRDAPRQPPGSLNTEVLRGAEQGLAFDGDDRFYLARSGTDEIVVHHSGDKVSMHLGKFDSDVHMGTRALGRGTGPEQVREPRGLFVWERIAHGVARDLGARALFVADSWNHRVSVFGVALPKEPLDWAVPVRTFGTYGSGDGELNHPNDVAVDARGHAYVADLGNDRIVEFDDTGKFVRSFGGRGFEPGFFLSPTGLDVHGERVYVADRDNHRIQVFDLEGRFLYEFGEPALRPREGRGKLHAPSDVAISPDGTRAVVVEEIEDRVQVFGLVAGDTPPSIPVRDSSAHYGGQCSARGELFAVAEPALGSVSVFDVSSGTPIEITKFGRPGVGPGRLSRPSAVLFDARAEVLYVADPFAYRVHAFTIRRAPDEPLRFDPDRARLLHSLDLRAHPAIGMGTSTEPVDLTLGPNGEVHVLDAANRRIVVLDASLKPLRKVAFGEIHPWPPAQSRALAFDATTGSWIFAPGTDDPLRLPGQAERTDVAFTTRGRPWFVDRGRHAVVRRRLNVGTSLATFDHVAGRRETVSAGEPVSSAPGAEAKTETRNRRGLGRGEFSHPESLAADGHGRVYVVDAGNHRIQILDEEGRYLDMFGARLYTEAGRTPPVERLARAWDGAASVRTSGGAYRVRWKLRGGTDGAPARFERGATATLDAWVFAVGRPDEPIAVEALAIDAWMPDHQHGLSSRPRVTSRDDRGYTIEGLRLFMSGAWEIDFDVLAGGVTERAQVRVELE